MEFGGRLGWRGIKGVGVHWNLGQVATGFATKLTHKAEDFRFHKGHKLRHPAVHGVVPRAVQHVAAQPCWRKSTHRQLRMHASVGFERRTSFWARAVDCAF